MSNEAPHHTPEQLKSYFQSGESWAADREQAQRSSQKLAWIAVGVLGAVALAEAVAILVMMPLKTVEPYTLLVDRQTGYVQALKPLERETVAPDKALTRSFIAQYVLAREGYEYNSLKADYRKVALWSAGEARDHYLREMQATSPTSRLVRLPRQSIVDVEVRAISSLSANTALVRFVTIRTDPGGQPQAPQPWQAVITFSFTGAAMSAADRLINPLGFQVTRYRRNAEIPLEANAQSSQNASTDLPVSPQQMPSISVAPQASTTLPAGTPPRAKKVP